jgi:hypothetical protein
MSHIVPTPAPPSPKQATQQPSAAPKPVATPLWLSGHLQLPHAPQRDGNRRENQLAKMQQGDARGRGRGKGRGDGRERWKKSDKTPKIVNKRKMNTEN